jgi:hypothetical protein
MAVLDYVFFSDKNIKCNKLFLNFLNHNLNNNTKIKIHNKEMILQKISLILIKLNSLRK